MTLFGFGAFNEVPTIYMLTYLRPYYLKALMEFPNYDIYAVNFNELFTKLAASLTGEILLGVEVDQTYRHDGDEMYVSYYANRRAFTQKCQALVVAFPPRLDRLNDFMDLGLEEMVLFDHVYTNDYYSGVANASSLDLKTMLNFLQVQDSKIVFGNAQPMGQPLLLKHWQPKACPNLVSFYSWGKEGIKQDTVRNLAVSTISKLNRPLDKPVNESIPLTGRDIKIFKSWDLFPHVSEHALKLGFYKKFKDIQGYRNTYYASGLNYVELVEYAIEAAVDLVDSYF